MKVFQGICKSENLYNRIERILGFALQAFCKSPNNISDRMYRQCDRAAYKTLENCNFKRFETETFIDWTCSTLFKAKGFIERSLERHFGSRKKWNFKTGLTKYFISQVVDFFIFFSERKHCVNLE